MDDAQRLMTAMTRTIDITSSKIESLRLADPARLIEVKAQSLDYASHKLLTSYEKILSFKSNELLTTGSRLRHPQQLVEEKTRNLHLFEQSLGRLKDRIFEAKEQELASLSRMLDNLSFENVLKRGYAVVRDAQSGVPISEPSQIASGQGLSLQFKDNQSVDVTADE
jgi:exodeoxyribonuclease VII large subunit